MYSTASSYPKPLPNHHHRPRCGGSKLLFKLHPLLKRPPVQGPPNATLSCRLQFCVFNPHDSHSTTAAALMNVTSWMASAFDSSLRPSLTESSAAATASGSGLKITVLFAETDPPAKMRHELFQRWLESELLKASSILFFLFNRSSAKP